MKKRKLPIVFLAIMSTTALAEENYLCITDKVSGFNHDSKRESWEHATFLPGERFEISEKYTDSYEIKKLGDKGAWWAICTARADQSEDSFSCRSRTNELHFNRKEMRFTSFRYFGYWNGSTDSLSIAIGKCFAT